MSSFYRQDYTVLTQSTLQLGVLPSYKYSESSGSLSPPFAPTRGSQWSPGHIQGTASCARFSSNPGDGWQIPYSPGSSGEKTGQAIFQLFTDLDFFFSSLSRLVILRKRERKPLVTSGISHTHEFSVKPNHNQHPA